MTLRGRPLSFAMSLGEVGTLLPNFAFAALAPTFIAAWAMTNTEAGWISGISGLGYMASVPVLMSLTDRLDARRVFLAGAALSTIAHLGFALTAEGFWSALLWRGIGGIGLAGTYMPGLRILTDRDESRE
jgi:MFS family permease